MNESESEVATSLAKNCGLLIVAANDMRDKQATHTWESLVHNVDQVLPVVLRSLKNRVQVTQDAEDKAVLEGVVVSKIDFLFLSSSLFFLLFLSFCRPSWSRRVLT